MIRAMNAVCRVVAVLLICVVLVNMKVLEVVTWPIRRFSKGRTGA